MCVCAHLLDLVADSLAALLFCPAHDVVQDLLLGIFRLPLGVLQVITKLTVCDAAGAGLDLGMSSLHSGLMQCKARVPSADHILNPECVVSIWQSYSQAVGVSAASANASAHLGPQLVAHLTYVMLQPAVPADSRAARLPRCLVIYCTCKHSNVCSGRDRALEVIQRFSCTAFASATRVEACYESPVATLTSALRPTQPQYTVDAWAAYQNVSCHLRGSHTTANLQKHRVCM